MLLSKRSMNGVIVSTRNEIVRCRVVTMSKGNFQASCENLSTCWMSCQLNCPGVPIFHILSFSLYNCNDRHQLWKYTVFQRNTRMLVCINSYVCWVCIVYVLELSWLFSKFHFLTFAGFSFLNVQTHCFSSAEGIWRLKINHLIFKVINRFIDQSLFRPLISDFVFLQPRFLLLI